MDGGIYDATVDLTTVTSYEVWKAKSFLIGGTAKLYVDSVNIPGTLPAKQPYPILQTSAKNSITGDFATKSLAIGTTGKSYTAGPDGTNQNYLVTTP
jgi:hypothetical protein